MKSIYYFFAAIAVIALTFSSCNLFNEPETKDFYSGYVYYEIIFDSLTVFSDDYQNIGFSKYFQTDISYTSEDGDIITEEDVNYFWKEVYAELPFEAFIEIRHSLRSSVVAGMSLYEQIPVYIGNICELRIEMYTDADESSTNYEWVVLSPLFFNSEIYLLQVENWLSEYGTQRYTMLFTEKEWEDNKRYK